jgi:hypothetical protein
MKHSFARKAIQLQVHWIESRLSSELMWSLNPKYVDVVTKYAHAYEKKSFLFRLH